MCFYTTNFSSAFVSNVEAGYRARGVAIGNFTNDEINLKGIERTFESILDDMLLGLSSAQLVLTSGIGAVSVPAKASIQAVVLGERSYIWAVFSLSSFTLVLFLIEAGITRGWQQLPKFDYNKSTDLILAASTGGKVLAEDVHMQGDSEIGKTRVRLISIRKKFALVGAGTRNLEQQGYELPYRY